MELLGQRAGGGGQVPTIQEARAHIPVGQQTLLITPAAPGTLARPSDSLPVWWVNKNAAARLPVKGDERR